MGHSADKCGNLLTLSGKKRSQQDPEVHQVDEELQELEDQEGGDEVPEEDPEVYECSICEAGSQESCTEVDDDECPHREERAEAYLQLKRWERKKEKKTQDTETQGKGKKRKKDATTTTSGAATAASASATASANTPAAPSPIRRSAGVTFDKPEEILDMTEEQLRLIKVKQIVGIPIAWQAWIKSRPVTGALNRREAWKELGEEIKRFYTLDRPADTRISKLDMENANRVTEQLLKLLDPAIGYGISGEAQRTADSIEYFSTEILAFQCARERGWFVARSAASIEDRQHRTLKGRDAAIKKACKAEKAKAVYKPGGGGGGRGSGPKGDSKESAGGRGKGRGRG